MTSLHSVNREVKKKVFILFIILFVFTGLVSQDKDGLEKQRKEYLKKIEYTNRLLKQNQKKIKNTTTNLSLVNSQIETRKKLIYTIESELDNLEKRIENNEVGIAAMENDLKKLQQEYARIIYSAYKTKKSSNMWLYVLASDNFSQAYKRYQYIMDYSKNRKKQKESIESIQDLLIQKNEDLSNQKKEKQELLFTYTTEADNLRKEIKNKESLIVMLKNKEKELGKQIEENKRKEKQIANEIAKLIREESRRNKLDYKENNELSNEFIKNAGKLVWPVSEGIIVSRYGKHFHPVLRNVELDNPGIDISTSSNASVIAVYDGEVSGVYGILGANNTVIIKHGSFYTVYQNVIDLKVKSGTKINKGDIIGKVYTDQSTNETKLHFQIWKGNSTVDPLQWITKNY